jgi:hypothetical protein
MSKPKEVVLKLVKTANGVSLSNESEMTIDIFDDTNHGRQELIKALIDQLLNAEVQGGREYG